MEKEKVDPTKDKTSEFYQQKIQKLQDCVKIFMDEYMIKKTHIVFRSFSEMLTTLRKSKRTELMERTVTIRVNIDGVSKEIEINGFIRSVFIGDFK